MALRSVNIHPNVDIKGAQLHWNSIFSCTFLMLGFGVFFLLFGNAIGLGPSNFFRANAGTAVKFWSWLYLAVSMVSSYFLGANFGTKVPGIATRGSAALHGLVAWGLANALIVSLGVNTSAGFRDFITGFGLNSTNWLAICIVGFGMVASILGGIAGRDLGISRTPLTEGLQGEAGRKMA